MARSRSTAGSHDEIEPSFFHGGSAGNFNYFVTGDFLRNDLGIESPDGRIESTA